MFNKIVLASSFAAIGYEEVPDRILKRIDDDATFIHSIQSDNSDSSSDAREYYLKLFSPLAVQSKIRQAIFRVESDRS
jgi:hypothetical protein